MNSFSFWAIILFGLLLGFIFPDLAEEAGLNRKKSHTVLMAFVPAIFDLLGFILMTPMIYGQFVFSDLNLFADTIFYPLALALLVGGFVHLAVHVYQYKEKPAFY